MVYAPVIIPTLNRYEHFYDCISSLQQNGYAKYTDIYIGVDFPPAPQYEEGHKKICRFLKKGFAGFKNVHVFFHQKNKGSSGNIIFLKEEVAKNFDRYIFTEDDNVFSPNFLEYMNRCLDMYENDDTIVAVSGYNYPIKPVGESGKIYFSNIYFSAYGYGTWVKKFEKMVDGITLRWAENLFHNNSEMRLMRTYSPNQYCNWIKSYLNYAMPIVSPQGIRRMDLTYGIYMFSEGLRMVFPCLSKVRNMGFDGSGINCGELRINRKERENHRNFDYSTQVIDIGKECSSISQLNGDEQKRIKELLDYFFYVSKGEIARSRVAFWCSLLLGDEFVRKILKGRK